eukprot:Ihof_evm5s253 gene=Ihof_evmTU5s253
MDIIRRTERSNDTMEMPPELPPLPPPRHLKNDKARSSATDSVNLSAELLPRFMKDDIFHHLSKKKSDRSSLDVSVDAIQQQHEKALLASGEEVEVVDIESLWEMETPEIVAALLLEGKRVRRLDICFYLSRKTDYGMQVAIEYFKLFNFEGVSLDNALRQFFANIYLEGETHDKARVLDHFSRRYFDANPGVFVSLDACNAMVFAVVLLNTDLHNPNVERRMTLNDFLRNTQGQNDGNDFPHEMLKEVYNIIKKCPLPTPSADGHPGGSSEDVVPSVPSFMSLKTMSKMSLSDIGLWRSNSTFSLPLPLRNQQSSQHGSPSFAEEDDAIRPVEQEGFLRKKTLMLSENKKAPLRGWISLYGQIKGAVLALYKSTKNNPTAKLDDKINLRHAYARQDASPRHAFMVHVTTYDYHQYHILTDTEDDMQAWVTSINRAAAVYSSPPLCTPISSQQGTFNWPPQSQLSNNHDMPTLYKLFMEKIVDLQLNLKLELEFTSESASVMLGHKKLWQNPKMVFFQYELK